MEVPLPGIRQRSPQSLLPAQEPVEAYGAFDAFKNQMALGVYGQIKDFGERLYARGAGIDATFDGLDNIPRGYEKYAREYAYARNAEEADVITRNINENDAARQRLSEYDLSTNLLSGFVAGLVDPVNLIPVPGLAGIGFVKAALRGGAAIGAINTGQEVLRHELDPTSSRAETAINIGAGVLLGGLFSGAIGHALRNRQPVPLDGLEQDAVNSLAARFDEAAAVGDSISPLSSFDMGGKGFKVVDGNTGKYDSSGSYQFASYRSASETNAVGARVTIDEVPVGAKSGDELLQDELSKPNPFEYDIDAPIGPTVYHGTRVSSDNVDSFIDGNGNLTLTPGENFGLSGVSFGVQRQVATDYSTRVRGGDRSANNSVVFEVEADAVPGLKRETMGEAAIYTDAPVVIPPGKWRLTDAMTGQPINVRLGADDIPAPTGFKTAKGSTYTLDNEGRTTRVKAKRNDPGHEGDFGPKATSAKTVYVESAEQAAALSAAGLQGLGEKGARVAIKDGKATLLTWNPKANKWGTTPSSRDISIYSEPAIGRAPLELWQLADDVPGFEAYSNMHAGNQITELLTPTPLRSTIADDSIVIDSSAAIAEFPAKPWTRPSMEGVAPLAADAFRTPAEWLDFLMLKEANRSITTKLATETDAAFENRISQIALEEVKSERAPLAAAGGRIARSWLAVIPTGRLVSLLGQKHRAAYELFEGIGGDYQSMTLANLVLRATTPGGSVFMKSLMWQRHVAFVKDANEQAYINYLRGETPQPRPQLSASTQTLVSEIPLIGRAIRGKKMTFPQFREFTGRAANTDEDFTMNGISLTPKEMSFVRKAGDQIRKSLADFEEGSRAAELFDGQKSLKREVAWRNAALDRNLEYLIELEGKVDQAKARETELGRRLTTGEKAEIFGKEMGKVAELAEKERLAGKPPYDPGFMPDGTPRTPPSLSTRARGYAERMVPFLKEQNQKHVDRLLELVDLEQTLNTIPIKPAREKYYFPRFFDIQKITDNFDGFVKRVAESFGGDEAAFGRARDVANRIIGNGGEEFLPTDGIGSPKNTRGRQLDLTNEELADFIVWDSDAVMGIYARRMGSAIEMQSRYGSLDLEEQLDELKTTLISEGYKADEITKAIQIIEDTRDKTLNRFHGKDPMSWDNRAVRVIKNVERLQTMGSAIYSQTTDVTKALAQIGYRPVLAALSTAWDGQFKSLVRGANAQQFAEGLELAMSSSMSRMIENDSALMVTRQTAFERGLAASQPWLFRANLMNPFTVVWKQAVAMIGNHRMIEDAVAIAKAFNEGRTAETLTKAELQTAARLSSFGINPRMARVIAEMPWEKTTDTGLILPNIDAWPGQLGSEAADVFRAAAQGQIRSAVITPGPNQRHPIMDGVVRWNGERKEMPFLSLPFSLLSFTVSSSAKFNHAAATGRDRSVTISLAALLMGGYITTWLRAGDRWESMDWKERFVGAFESSGIMGWMGEVVKKEEMITGYGLKSIAGIEPYGEDLISQKVGAIAGPAAGIMAGVIEAFANTDPNITEYQRAGMIRRALPFASLIEFDFFMKDFNKMAVDSGLIEDFVEPEPDFEEEDAAVEAASPLSPESELNN